MNLHGWIWILLAALAPLDSYAGSEADGAFAQWGYVTRSDSGQDQFALRLDSGGGQVEATRLDDGSLGAPPYLRLRAFTEDGLPIEVNLKPVDAPASPLRYTGQIDNPAPASYIGAELEFSFDERTWKKVGDAILQFVR